MQKILWFGLLSLTQALSAQDTSSVVPVSTDTSIHYIECDFIEFPDIDAHFDGGDIAFHNFIRENIKYPELAREMGESGVVYVQFIVNTDGSITDVTVVKGVSPSLDAEAVRVIRSMPGWIPGEQAGKKVRTRFCVPITFEIRN